MSNPTYTPPVALAWNRHACDALYLTETPPTIASRVLAMLHTAMYDAMTLFLPGEEMPTTAELRALRDMPCDDTPANRQEAYSYAAYQVLIADEIYANPLPKKFRTRLASYFKSLGYNPNNREENTQFAYGVGNLAARLILESRMDDCANQDNGFADYTGYKPVNQPPPEIPHCIDRWQPQIQSDKKIQAFMTPHWGTVRPFGLSKGSQFRPKAPIQEGKAGFKEQGIKVTDLSAKLTDEEKMMAEFWAGMHEDLFPGLPSTNNYSHWIGPPAQCCRIICEIMETREIRGVPAVVLFFVMGNALLDASIAAWDSKRHYDYVRPQTLIWRSRDNETFPAWGGPGRGSVEMEGEGWMSYISPPPFAEYVSGHSTFSHTMAEIVNCFFGDTQHQSTVLIPQGASKIEGDCDPALPMQEVCLSWNTVEEMADQAGMSRQYGGIHFEDGDMEGRKLGRKVALCVWNKACEYLTGAV